MEILKSYKTNRVKTKTMIYRLLSICFLIITINIHAQIEYRLPKVLFITSGADAGRGTVSDGVVMALQAFHKQGAFVRLENRNILLQADKLQNFDILIVPTITGYHDQSRKNSLTYLSDLELNNIEQWVKNGGTLLTDINMGRNNLNGKDRLLDKNVLKPGNSIFARIFGADFKEINMLNFAFIDRRLHIWKNPTLREHNERWRLIPFHTNPSTEILGVWKNDQQEFPAIIKHRYGAGNAVLLPSFYLLHPVKDGGQSTEKQIDKFYQWLFEISIGKRSYPIYLLPWKNAYTSVYCQTFDDGGNMEQYKRIFDFINKNNLPTVFFVTPGIKNNIKQELKKQRLIDIQGHSYHHPDFRKLNYEQTFSELLMNRKYWNKNFSGFRFPYVSNSFWGLYALDRLGFLYDTSIAVNHLEFIRGSVVPYNIPIFNKDMYLTLNLLEISQIYHSDWYFYQKSLEKKPYTTKEQKDDARRFKTYLFQYFDKIVAPNQGVMVFLGHPMYSGISDTTLEALQDLIDYLKTKNVWFTSINTVAERWNKLQNLQIEIKENRDEVIIKLNAENEIEGVSLLLPRSPVHIDYNKKYRLKKIENKTYLIIEKVRDDNIKIKFKE